MEKKIKETEKNNIISTLILVIFIILLVISSVEIIKWCISNKENEQILEEISESVINTQEENDIEEGYHIDFETLKEKNKDTVAFLKVNETNIETIVVKGTNNEYYLNHNFEKKNNKAGWIFADYKNKFDGTDKNIVIYGHNRKDGSMFGTLKNILTENWNNNEENRKITFITESENCTYEVFSIYQIEAEDYYITTDFKDEEFSKYIETVKNRSIKDFNIEVSEKDNILTLSTCANDDKYRVVLHAKKIT